MKLKPVVASLVMLGMMTPAAFAKSSMASRQAILDQNSVTLPCAKGWTDRIQVAALGSIVGVAGNHSPVGHFTDKDNGSDLYINNVNVLLKGDLSSWSKLNVNLAYLGAPEYVECSECKTGDNAESSKRIIRNSVLADEFYVTIGNLNSHPFYLDIGKKYLPFGDYSGATYIPYQIKSPAQMLSQTNAVAAVGGLSSDFGLYANVFGFRGETSPKNSTTLNIRNFGAKLGYYSNLDEFNLDNTRFNIAVSYLHNIYDVEVFNGANQWYWEGCNIYERASAGSVHIDVAYKAFSMFANFVGALTELAKTSYNSKIWGADVGADYAFKTFSHDSHLGASIQWSGNAKWMSQESNRNCLLQVFPQWRLVGEYGVNLFKNTDLSLVVAHGKSFDFTPENTNKTERNSTLGLARLSVKI